jgi:hypothetical protein
MLSSLRGASRLSLRSSLLRQAPLPPSVRLRLPHSTSLRIRALSSTPPPRGGAGRASLAFATLGLLTGKAKFLLTGLKLFKFTPVLSMLGTTVTYSLFFGPAYSFGMVGLIAVHEAGHAIGKSAPSRQPLPPPPAFR